MRLNRIEGRHLRRRKHTTVPDRFAPPAPDLVQRDFSAGHLDEKRCGDITYVQVGGSWLYPACVIDICTRGCSRRCVRRDWRSSSGSPTTTLAGDTAPSATSRLSSSNSTTRENVESHSQHEPPCPHPGGTSDRSHPRYPDRSGSTTRPNVGNPNHKVHSTTNVSFDLTTTGHRATRFHTKAWSQQLWRKMSQLVDFA